MPEGDGTGRSRACVAAAALASGVAIAALPGAIGAGIAPAITEPAIGESFRVCADPNNLPFSNQAQEGFENRLAELAAAELQQQVTYTWHPQRRGFIRETLNADQCDAIMGVPQRLDAVETTRPYYRSGYVFLSRADRHLDIASIQDPRLAALRIGVQLIGDAGFNTPPPHALAAQGLARNLVGYPVYGDYGEPNPPAHIVTAVERRDVDIAAVWGPLAGYFAKQSSVPLVLTPITDTQSFAPLRFRFDIAIGVRKGDRVLRDKLDDMIARKRPQIVALLLSYGLPLLGLGPSEQHNGESPGN